MIRWRARSSGERFPPPQGGEHDEGTGRRRSRKRQLRFRGAECPWKVDGNQAGGRFSVVHHPIAAHALGAPLHYHHNEDELSYVLTGRLGALLGDAVVTAEPGTWVFKPRQQWHTFWNAGETPCEIIEVISPAGFEKYFREITPCRISRSSRRAFARSRG